MKNKLEILIIIVFICLASVSSFMVIQHISVINSAEETIRTNNNVSENSSVNIWIGKHTWKSDWYMIYYTIKIPDYVCSKREKENFPWRCEEIHNEFNSGYIWFNMKTKELHQPDIWK